MKPVIEQVSINGTFYGLNKITGEIIQFNSEKEANEQCALEGSKALKNLVYKEGEDIAITIELNSECNLKCIYCYQTDKGTRSEITTEIIEMIVEYISKVYERYQFSRLVLRFIGGEPLLSAEKLLLCYREIMKFCKDKGIDLYTHIDSNGTMPYNDLLQEIMNLDMVICLSLENDHNVKRYGSFNKIVNNLNSLPYLAPCPISLRYNVAHDNIHSFETFLMFVRENFPQVKDIETARIDDNACWPNYINQLDKSAFAIWNSTTAIDLLVKYDFNIMHCMRSKLTRCQGYSKYSCKIYSDGAITVCDAMYHAQSKLRIDELVRDTDLLKQRYLYIKDYLPLKDPKCAQCVSLVQCGGQVFCRDKKAMCDYQSEYNEKEFIKTYIKHLLNGNAKYFVNIS